MIHSLILLAEAAGGGAENKPPPSIFQSFLENPIFALLIPGMLLFYLLFLRPMKRQEAERQALLTKMKKNDEVITTSGIYATIVEVSDKEDKVTVKVADNVRLKIIKSAIARNLTNEEEAAKAKQAPKKEGAA